MDRWLPILAIVLAATPSFASDFDLCGTLAATVSCGSEPGFYFDSDSSGYYVLDTFLDFDAGDHVHLAGTSPGFCWTAPCMSEIGCIEVESLEFCFPVSRATGSWGAVKALYE